MERDQLEKILKTVAPALSTHDIIPVFQCFCFSGGTITAFDERVAMQMPCEDFGLEGAVDGKLLMRWVSAATKDLEATTNKGDLLLKSGRSRIKLPIIPKSDFLFEYPNTKKAPNVYFESEDFISALQRAMVSLGIDPGSPTLLGITLEFSEGVITMYSSNNVTLTRTQCVANVPIDLIGLDVIMPPRLVSLIYKSRTLGFHQMTVGKGYFSFDTAEGVRVFGRQARGADVDQFLEFLEGVVWGSPAWCRSPEGFKEAIQRSMMMGDDPRLEIEVSGQIATLKTRDKKGESKDKIKFKGHGDTKVTISPSTLKASADFYEDIQLVEGECLALQGEGFQHIVSLLGDE